MIIGVMINGYKSYRKATYLPITESVEDRYTTYIGNNGVGKSAILESLDVFFNSRGWNVCRGATREEIYIAPVMLLEKTKFCAQFVDCKYYAKQQIETNQKLIEKIEIISSYIFEELDKEVVGAVRRDYYIQFNDMILKLRKDNIQEKFYIIVLGIDYDNKISFKPFNSNIEKKLSIDSKDSVTDIAYAIKGMLDSYFAYVYIPVEQNVDSILKVEARQMQMLMNRDVLEEIDKILLSKVDDKKNILDIVNNRLNEFMFTINKSIQCIDEQYSYNPQAFVKKNLTAADIRDKILEAYFKIRCLRYNGKGVSELSSGEQRKALIDIAYAFLSNNEKNEKEIILAIDEPESSLNTSKCFSQFERLEQLSNCMKNQVLLTTHWYGALPISKKGNLYHIENEESDTKISHFSFFNYLTETRAFPDDIEMKSMFDLASSIISYVRNNPYCKWIICEGSSDKIYLESMFNNEDIRILPMGGCRRVISLYNLLVNSINDEFIKGHKNKGLNILCLIDTDEIKMDMFPNKDKMKVILMRRIQGQYKDIDGNLQYAIELVDPFSDGKLYKKTEIEDCLSPKEYYNAIHNVITKDTIEDMSTIFSKFEFNENVPGSCIEGNYSIIYPKDVKDIVYKEKLLSYLSKGFVKYSVALEYVKYNKEECSQLEGCIRRNLGMEKPKNDFLDLFEFYS